MDCGENCSICFEPFGKSPFGCIAPCGHCFHNDCFGKWETQCRAKQTGRNHKKKVPCPNCQQPAESFAKKLFLNFSGNISDRDSGSFACIASPGDRKGSADAAKWKRKADELEVSARTLRSSCQELSAERRDFLSEREGLVEKIQSLESRCDNLEKAAKENDSILADTLVTAERAERLRNELEKERRELKADLIRRKEDVKALKEALANVKEKYATDLARLENQGMIEIEEVLSQHPKLKQENHALRAELSQKTKEAAALKSRLLMQGKGDKARLELQLKGTPQHRAKNAEKVVKAMQHMRREEDQRSRKLLKRKHSEQNQEELSRKRLSVNATRIVRAMKKAGPRSTDIASSALNTASHLKATPDSTSRSQEPQRCIGLSQAVQRQSQRNFHCNHSDYYDSDDKPIQSRSSLSSLLEQEPSPDTGAFSSNQRSGPEISIHLSRTQRRTPEACRQNASSGAVLVGLGDASRGSQYCGSKSHQKIQAGQKREGNDIRAMFRNSRST